MYLSSKVLLENFITLYTDDRKEELLCIVSSKMHGNICIVSWDSLLVILSCFVLSATSSTPLLLNHMYQLPVMHSLLSIVLSSPLNCSVMNHPSVYVYVLHSPSLDAYLGVSFYSCASSFRGIKTNWYNKMNSEHTLLEKNNVLYGIKNLIRGNVPAF